MRKHKSLRRIQRLQMPLKYSYNINNHSKSFHNYDKIKYNSIRYICNPFSCMPSLSFIAGSYICKRRKNDNLRMAKLRKNNNPISITMSDRYKKFRRHTTINGRGDRCEIDI